MSSSSIRPAENPSTGFLLSSVIEIKFNYLKGYCDDLIIMVCRRLCRPMYEKVCGNLCCLLVNNTSSIYSNVILNRLRQYVAVHDNA